MTPSAHDLIRIGPLLATTPFVAIYVVNTRHVDILWDQFFEEWNWCGMCVKFERAVKGIYESAIVDSPPPFHLDGWIARRLGADLPELLRRAAVQAIEAYWAKLDEHALRTPDHPGIVSALKQREIDRAWLSEKLGTPLPVVGGAA